MKFTLPPLPYGYSDLQQSFDAQTMEIHHTQHHQGYVNKLNAAIKGKSFEQLSLENLMARVSTLPPAVRNNGGGHYNHSFFWTILTPHGGGGADGELAAALEKKFSSFDRFKEVFAECAAERFGSGWAWLVWTENKELKIFSTPNQDNPLMDDVEERGSPLLGIDVWEHAYYLKYQNRREEYIKAFWDVVNWEEVKRRYLIAKESEAVSNGASDREANI